MDTFIFNLLLWTDIFVHHSHTKSCCFYCKADSNKGFFDGVKLTKYLASVVIVLWSNTCIGPSPKTVFFIISMHRWTK